MLLHDMDVKVWPITAQRLAPPAPKWRTAPLGGLA